MIGRKTEGLAAPRNRGRALGWRNNRRALFFSQPVGPINQPRLGNLCAEIDSVAGTRCAKRRVPKWWVSRSRAHTGVKRACRPRALRRFVWVRQHVPPLPSLHDLHSLHALHGLRPLHESHARSGVLQCVQSRGEPRSVPAGTRYPMVGCAGPAPGRALRRRCNDSGLGGALPSRKWAGGAACWPANHGSSRRNSRHMRAACPYNAVRGTCLDKLAVSF